MKQIQSCLCRLQLPNPLLPSPAQQSVMSSIAFTTQQAPEALNKLMLLFSLCRGRAPVLQRIYIQLLEQRLEVQRNSLALANFSCLSLANTNHRTAEWKGALEMSRTKSKEGAPRMPGKMAHKRQYWVLLPWAWQPQTKQGTRVPSPQPFNRCDLPMQHLCCICTSVSL